MTLECLRCGAKDTLTSVNFVSDKTNTYGRRELTWQAESDNPVHWNPETRLYECSRCGFKFTFREAVLEKIDEKNPYQ